MEAVAAVAVVEAAAAAASRACTTARSFPWRWKEPTYDFARSLAFGRERSVGATRAGGGPDECTPFFAATAPSSAVMSSSYFVERSSAWPWRATVARPSAISVRAALRSLL